MVYDIEVNEDDYTAHCFAKDLDPDMDESQLEYINYIFSLPNDTRSDIRQLDRYKFVDTRLVNDNIIEQRVL
jgi:hypothetical protein